MIFECWLCKERMTTEYDCFFWNHLIEFHKVTEWPDIFVLTKKSKILPCKHYDREEINLILDGKTPPKIRCKICGFEF